MSKTYPGMVRKRIIKTPAFDYAALEWGNPSAPKILALHGWLDNAATFLPMVPYLKDHHVIAIDLLGHGLSPHIPKGGVYHFIDGVGQIFDVLNALKWKRCVLMGHSMGGALSTLATGTFGDRIEKLVLIEALGPFSRNAGEGPKYLLKHLEARSTLGKKKIPSYKTKEEAAQARKNAGDFSLELSRVLCERGLKRNGLRWTWRTDPRLRLESAWRMTEEQTLFFLKGIACPTLLIAGKSGMRWEPALIKERMKAISKLESTELEGGHHVHMEKPEECARLINQFLKMG